MALAHSNMGFKFFVITVIDKCMLIFHSNTVLDMMHRCVERYLTFTLRNNTALHFVPQY